MILFTSIDFETVPGEFGPEPAEFALVEMDEQAQVHHFFEAAVPVNAEYASSPFCRDDLQQAWPEVKEFLQKRIIIGHNIAYDRALLRQIFPSCQASQWLDTLELARKILPPMPSYALEELIPAIGLQESLDALRLTPHHQAHRALYDAVAAALLLLYLKQIAPDYPFWKENEPEEPGLF